MNSCPVCKSSWIGDPIPDAIKDMYEGTHWRREIGIEVREIYDGLCAVKCPDCGEHFPTSNHPISLELYEKYEKYLYHKG